MSDKGQNRGVREIRTHPSLPTGFGPGSGRVVSTICPQDAAEALRNAEID